MSDLHFGVIGEDGIYVRPVPIDCDEIRLEPADDSFDVTGIRNGFSGTFSATLVSVDHDAIRDLFGDARQSTYAIAFDHYVAKGLYRYDRVWRYRMECKGDKSNRRRRRRKRPRFSVVVGKWTYGGPSGLEAWMAHDKYDPYGYGTAEQVMDAIREEMGK